MWKVIKKTFYVLWLVVSRLFVIGVLAAFGVVAYVAKDLPDVTDLESFEAAQSTEIFDSKGNLLYTIHGAENRKQVSLDEISDNLEKATLAIEDDNFYSHPGFDVWAIGKAVMYEFFEVGSARGGSTLTQQYIKNAFLSPERDYVRKLKEIILAVRLEREYSKDNILALYLNLIPYGNNAHGAEKAAETYFGKTAKDLTVAESAILAALPQAPSRYNPYGNNKYTHLLKEFTEEELASRNISSEADLQQTEFARGLLGATIELLNGTNLYLPGRADLVVYRMHELGYIGDQEKAQALAELSRMEFKPYKEEIRYPHFVFYVTEILEKKYGRDMLERGGLKVYTTLDPDLQDYAEGVALEHAEINKWRFGANNLSMVTANPQTGEILAMVGSVDYFNEEIDGNVNVALRPRQPGSSFKPIVYAEAFNHGYAPGNIVYDVPTKIYSKTPQNYDGQFRGQMTLRTALAQSRNIPAIKAYYLAGEQDNVIHLSSKMGITTLDPEHSYGYPLALGAGEVPLIEMVSAFSTFANGGKKPELTGVARVENSEGHILEELRPKELDQALNPQVAYLISSILSDRKNGIGPNLFVDGHINAAKTGTSTKATKGSGQAVRPGDVWTIGYTPTRVTAVWVGNTKGEGLAFSANGYDTAAPIFKKVMTEALKDLPNEPFVRPAGVRTAQTYQPVSSKPDNDEGQPLRFATTDVFASFSEPVGANVYYPRKLAPIGSFLNWNREVEVYYEAVLEKYEEEQEEAEQPQGLLQQSLIEQQLERLDKQKESESSTVETEQSTGDEEFDWENVSSEAWRYQ